MSTNTINYIVSGVHTAMEFPDRVHASRRFGWGLNVRQEADLPGRTNNWFHLGIPYIPSDRFSAGSVIKKIFLQMELNENARLAEIHLRGRRDLLYNYRPNIIGRNINNTYDLNYAMWDKPLTVCMRIEFLSGSPMGEVTFLGAGLQVVMGDND